MYKFENIAGNEYLLKNLIELTNNNLLSHGYLFTGDEGTGKKIIANTLTKYILCHNKKFNFGGMCEPCGYCKNCITTEGGNNPNIIYVGYDLFKEKEKGTIKKNIEVDDIRNIINDLRYKPISTMDNPDFIDKKVYIIDNADKMTIPAQNALLKTLEEAPEFAIFFMISKNSKSLLPTIISRVVEIKIPPLPQYIVNDYIRNYIYSNNISIDNNQIEFISNYSKGSIGYGLLLLNDDTLLENRNNIINDLIDISKIPLGKALLYSKKWESEYKNYEHFFPILEVWYRDLLIAKLIDNEKYIMSKDKVKELFEIASKYNSEDIGKKYQSILEAKESISKNGDLRLTLDVLLLNLKGE